MLGTRLLTKKYSTSETKKKVPLTITTTMIDESNSPDLLEVDPVAGFDDDIEPDASTSNSSSHISSVFLSLSLLSARLLLHTERTKTTESSRGRVGSLFSLPSSVFN